MYKIYATDSFTRQLGARRLSTNNAHRRSTINQTSLTIIVNYGRSSNIKTEFFLRSLMSFCFLPWPSTSHGRFRGGGQWGPPPQWNFWPPVAPKSSR